MHQYQAVVRFAAENNEDAISVATDVERILSGHNIPNMLDTTDLYEVRFPHKVTVDPFEGALTRVYAPYLQPGDYIVNVGTVAAVNSVSVTSAFTAIAYDAEVASLATGRIDTVRRDLVVHSGEDFLVRRNVD